MAVRYAAIDLLPKEIQSFTDREFRWLWHYFISLGVIHQQWESTKPHVRIAIIGSHLDLPQWPNQSAASVLRERENSLIPLEYLAWIDKNDDRLLIWLLLQAQRLGLYRNAGTAAGLMQINASTIPSERRYDEFLATIDAWPTDRHIKETLISDLKADWGYRKTPEKDHKWITVKNDSQVVWAWTYLLKSGQAILVPPPIRNSEIYAAVLASIDEMSSTRHPAEKQLFLEKMKKTWSQKQYRDSGKAKKPYYLPLTKKARDQLDWLAKYTDVKTNAVLEEMIEAAYSAAKTRMDGR